MRKVLSSSWDIIFYLCLKSLSLSLVFIFNRCLWSLVFRLQLPTSCPQPPNLPPPSSNLQPPPCPNQAWFPTGSHIFFQTAHPAPHQCIHQSRLLSEPICNQLLVITYLWIAIGLIISSGEGFSFICLTALYSANTFPTIGEFCRIICSRCFAINAL